ncbi:BSD domain-containing protein 1 [Actinomortierella wolfii]|nr:BSD domain-containing protein 1 [Actinomortierella wolfii]
MDDLYQFMSPQEGAPTINETPPSTKAAEGNKDKDASTPSSTSTPAESKRTSTWGSWGSASSWGASFNKLIEKGKKDMHEFVDVTRKDLSELVQTVQAESSTTIESLSKTVEGIRTNLPPLPSTPLPTTAHSVDMLSRIKQPVSQGDESSSTSTQESASSSGLEHKDNQVETSKEEKDESAKSIPEGETPATESKQSEQQSSAASSSSSSTRSQKTTSQSFGLAAASLLSNSAARANTLSQSLTSSTKELSSTASSLFKKTLQPAVEKQLGEADAFLKHTAESLKTNGLMAEQYVNKLGTNVANFINSAVVVSAPAAASVTPRNKRPVFDRKEAMLENLRMDPATYTTDPLTTIPDNDIVSLERYKTFLQTFNIAEYQQRISRLLNEYPEVKTLMTKLVPVDVEDEELFWQRYFFRIYEIEEEEKRRKKLVQAAGKDSEEDLTWDDSDSEDEEETNAKAKDGSATPKAPSSSVTDPTTPKPGKEAVTPKAAASSTALTPEALASSLAALPVPSENDGKSQDSDDEWGGDSPAVASNTTSPSAVSALSGANKESSTRTSEENYEVVDGSVTPARAPESTVMSLSSTAATSPIVDQHPTVVPPAEKSKDEDDWSDWE